MDAEQVRQLQVARWAALTALEERVIAAPAAAGRVHAGLLRDVLELAGGYAGEGQSLSVAPQVALLLRCSGARADRLLNEAAVLAELPEGWEALAQGVLTVEQSAVVARELGRVPDLPTRLVVWRQLLSRLRADLSSGAVLPAPRLRELLRRWVLELAAKDAQEQRADAAAERRVEYRRREDGLTDILLFGIESTLAQAVLQRVRTESAPVGLFDERTADQRRLDAAVDLLLGRVGQPAHCSNPSGPAGAGSSDGPGSGGGSRAGCGCLPGTPVPCGAQLLIHVPLGAALGTTGEVAELVGHGPLEPDVLLQLLLAAPLLQAVHVDPDGVPVAVSDHVRRPERRDLQSVRSALLDLATQPPGRLYPRHADDHQPADRPDDQDPDEVRPDDQPAVHPEDPPGSGEDPPDSGEEPAGPATAAGPGGGPHPPDTPGPYRPSGRLRRLVQTRAPRCEFPGCGMPSVACDAEHDQAWPDGPTCACQLGPCCRRHHRTKQEGWTKQRLLDAAVRWTSPTGRSWTSPAQHPAPAAALRPLRPVPTPSPWDELDPISLEHLLCELDDRPDDPAALQLRAPDVDPDQQHDHDRLGELLSAGRTRWTIDLDDPYGWTSVPDARELAGPSSSTEVPSRRSVTA